VTRILVGVSLLLVPVSIGLRFAGVPDVLAFLVGAAALVPLAGLISKATEEAERNTNPAVGALLNASFGNATEFAIAFFAISSGAFEVVRGSLTGSVVANLLLLLGLVLVVGKESRFDRAEAIPPVALAAVAAAVFVIPAADYWDGGDRARAVATTAVPVAALLLLAGVAYWTYAVRRELRAGRERAEAEWTLRRALVVLGLGVVATGIASEVVTGALEGFSKSVGLTEFAVAFVLVALLGNAAEHGAAVVAAVHGEQSLGIDLSTTSAGQVAVLLLPGIALASWLLDPLPLAFHPVELAALGASAVLAAAVLSRGRSWRLGGAVLVAAYLVVVAAVLATHGLR
jgi:Ca2+:H+ antiporter